MAHVKGRSIDPGSGDARKTRIQALSGAHNASDMLVVSVSEPNDSAQFFLDGRLAVIAKVLVQYVVNEEPAALRLVATMFQSLLNDPANHQAFVRGMQKVIQEDQNNRSKTNNPNRPDNN